MSKLLEIDLQEVLDFAARVEGVDALVADEVRLTMQKSLDLFEQAVMAGTPVNTGALRQSIGTQMYGTSPMLIGKVTTTSPYGEAVEFGRRPGKMPPVGAIKQWVVRKGIASGAGADGVAYIIARAIGRRGTKGAKMFARAFDSRYSTAVTDKVLLLWDELPARVLEKLSS